METQNPSTQKAKGVLALYRYGLTFETHVYPVRDVEPKRLIGKFCRPCPIRPRHGFVDSRVINNAEEAQQLIAETIAADPDAEIITMPFCDAQYSGIWTRGLLTIGRGTDGATAGTSAVQIPAIGTFPTISDYLIQWADIQNAPYVELLWQDGKHNPTAVQLRDGPELPETVDYIPQVITVQRVIRAEGDLLEWEAKVKAFEPGTVVWHPNGSLASHYSIHAVLAHVPVIISHEPMVGDVLEPNTAQLTADVQQLRAGFLSGVRSDLSTTDAARVMLAGCHHIAVWRGKQDYLLGIALGCAFRLTVTAALGEERHRIGKHGRKYGRDEIYTSAWNRVAHSDIKTRFENALHGFIYGDWKHAFGGYSWFKFARWAAMIQNHLLEGNGEAALNDLNEVVHSAHNTGWGFNKFICKSELEETARNPMWMLVKVATRLHKFIAEQVNVEKMAVQFMRRKPISIPHDPNAEPACALNEPKPIEVAQAKIVNSTLHIQYKPADNGGAYGTLNVPLTAEMESAFHNLPAHPSFCAGSLTKYRVLEHFSSEPHWYIGSTPIPQLDQIGGNHVA